MTACETVSREQAADALHALDQAIDRLTKPTRRRVMRAVDPDETPPWEFPGWGCDVATHTAATTTSALVPGLWEQAVLALMSPGTEHARAGRPARERTPADIDLMEMMAQIREGLSAEFKTRKVRPRSRDVRRQLRQWAALVHADPPDGQLLAASIAARWARLLATHVQATEPGPKLRTLRAACPDCGTRQTRARVDGEWRLVSPLLIGWTGDGWMRSIVCTVCGSAWWRGEDLHQLADRLDTPTPGVVADVG